MSDSPNGVVETRYIEIDAVRIHPDRGEADMRKVSDLAQSIAEIGLLNAITIDLDYTLIAGHHRLLACRQLEYATIRANVVDMVGTEAELAEIDENLIRREFTRLERAELLQRRKEIFEARHAESNGHHTELSGDAAEGYSLREFYEDAASKLGVGARTIERDVQIAANTDPEVRDLIRRTPIADNKDELLALSRIDRDEQKQVVEDLISQDPERVRRGKGRLAPLMSSASPEWYTPSEILDRVVETMGGIDLDPCSNSHESPNVPASTHFTEEDDGLNQDWFGRVYMNPPYGRVIDQWAEKLIEEYEAGRVKQAIALVPARTDTAWFRRFREFPRCFVNGRLKFSEYENSAPFPSAIIALGCDIDKFALAFDDMGDVFQVYNA